MVLEVSNARENDRVLYVKKAMIGCGLALNLNGQCDVQQVLPHLQEIVKNFPGNFDGFSEIDSMELDGAVIQSKDEKEGDGDDQNN